MNSSARRATVEPETKVYRELLDLIVTGALAPGSRISGRDLAQHLRVSRTPVREAVHRLQLEGLVVANQAKTYARPFVAALTDEDVSEIHDIAASLEVVVARRAAALPVARRRELSTAMSACNEVLANTIGDSRHTIADLVELDHAFHESYVAQVAGPRVAAMRRLLKPQLERYARSYPTALEADMVREVVAEHADIVAAIRTGDARAAETAVLTNWHRGCERIRRVIESSGERGTWRDSP